MYSKILIVLSSGIGVTGTVYAVLSILKMTAKDIIQVITVAGIGARDEEVIVQRAQARIGISLVVLGWIGQSAFCFFEVQSRNVFFTCLIVLILLTSVIVSILILDNKKFGAKCKAEKDARS